jgi:polyhydroxyalkanoate synthesis regulator phasin
MEDLFKKFVNAGVGYIAQGSKTVQSTIEKLVRDNKMTQEEGKKIVDDLMKSGETKRKELEKQFQGLTERVRTTVGLGDAKKGAAKPAAKKSSAKPASSATSKAAGTTKKAADKVSSAAGTAQKSAAAKAGAAKKPAAPKKPAASAAPAGDQA